MGWLFEPGFFSSPEVRTALAIGGVTAVVSAIVGVFAVVRGQSFAGHALTDAAATGGSGAVLVGMSPLAGFVAGSLAGAGAMGAIGVRNVRGRDLATGVVLGAAIGLASLFLYLTTTTTTTSGSTQQILFGSIFAIDPTMVPGASALGALAVGLVAVTYRPLLLTSVHPDIAAARGVPLRVVEAAFMGALALAVGLSSLAIGAILSTALLIGPPAAALRVTARPARAIGVSCALGIAATWLGILIAYDSADWAGGSYTLPVSFCVVALVFLAYVACGSAAALHAIRSARGDA